MSSLVTLCHEAVDIYKCVHCIHGYSRTQEAYRLGYRLDNPRQSNQQWRV